MKIAPLVCHFTSVHPAHDTRIFVKECRSLAREGFRVKLVVANGVSATVDGVEIIGVPIEPGRLSRMWKGAREVARVAETLDADIYHFHDPELLRFVNRFRKKGKVVIYDSHEDLPRQIAHKYYIPNALKPLVALVVERIENRWARKCSAIVTATAYIRDRFRSFHNEVVDVCNYPLLEEIESPDLTSPRKPVACYVGSITEARGLRDMTDMMEHASFRLILAGPVDPPSLLEEMRKKPGWQRIDYRGPVSREQVTQILKESAVGLVTMHNTPNYAHALPVKMFEYMAAGLAVVTNCIPLWKNIVEENECGVAVDTSDPGTFRCVVEALLAHEDRVIRYGKNGRKAIEESLNWKPEEHKLVALYLRLNSGDE